jgi:hypothetical protein
MVDGNLNPINASGDAAPASTPASHLPGAVAGVPGLAPAPAATHVPGAPTPTSASAVPGVAHPTAAGAAATNTTNVGTAQAAVGAVRELMQRIQHKVYFPFH